MVGDHRGGKTPSLGSPPSCGASALSALISYCVPHVLPTRLTHTLLWGKLRQRPHSKFSGLKPALELPLPLASSSNLDGGLRRPGRGIPRAQAAFQPATSASDLCHQKSAQRLQSPWGQSHSNSIPTPVLRQQPSNACPGLWGAPSPNLT